jgi:hypothetical protein
MFKFINHLYNMTSFALDIKRDRQYYGNKLVLSKSWRKAVQI